MIIHELLTLPCGVSIEKDPCLFWADTCGEPLLSSLETWGQIEPVIVCSKGSRLVLVAGYKRHQGLKSLGLNIQALHISNPGAWGRGMVYLLSNLGQSLDPLKKILALRYFESMKKDLSRIHQLLGIPSGSRDEHLFSAWLNLPSTWDGLLRENPQLLPCAGMLSSMDSKDLDVVFPFLSGLGWSLNRARGFLGMLNHIAARDRKSLRDVAAELHLERVLHRDLTPKDKMQALLNSLNRAAYPEYSRLREKTKKQLDRLTASTDWQCTHPDNFESPALEFRVRVRNSRELGEAAGQLQKIAGSGIMSTWPVYPYD